MTIELPSPQDPHGDTAHRFLTYLDFYRALVEAKVSGLDDDALRHSRVPSGWSPIGLIKHLAFMERRWLRWGFTAEQVEEPWGDQDQDGTWVVAPDESLGPLLRTLRAGGETTREIVEGAALTSRAATGGRFETADDCPTLEWILFHVLQEYARHAGHLDIARELIDGSVGED